MSKLSIKESIYEIANISLSRILKELKSSEDDNYYLNVRDLKELVGLLKNIDDSMLEDNNNSIDTINKYEVNLGGYEDE